MYLYWSGKYACVTSLSMTMTGHILWPCPYFKQQRSAWHWIDRNLRRTAYFLLFFILKLFLKIKTELFVETSGSSTFFKKAFGLIKTETQTLQTTMYTTRENDTMETTTPQWPPWQQNFTHSNNKSSWAITSSKSVEAFGNNFF